MGPLKPVKPPLTVINLWGGPGIGKSTTAAGLFNLMKHKGLRVELVTEYAKDAVYQQDRTAMDNQLWLLANQDMRLRRLVGQVDYAVCDSPLPLVLAYATDEYKGWIGHTVDWSRRRYRNVDFLLLRTKDYQAYGRRETEREAMLLDVRIESLFMSHYDRRMHFSEVRVPGDGYAPDKIIAVLHLCGLLQNANI